MQKAISNKIQLGDTLNLLKDYAGVPSMNAEGNLENLIQKVDKMSFGRWVKLMEIYQDIFQIFYQ